jgi:hypothetical protein
MVENGLKGTKWRYADIRALRSTMEEAEEVLRR